MSNVIEAGPNIFQSSAVPLFDRSNYNIISRSNHWNTFCKKCALEISRKLLQKYLWLSSFFVKKHASSLQLYWKWIPPQVFSGILPRLSEQLLVVHSWQRVLNSPILWRPPILRTFFYQILSNLPSSLSPTTFTFPCNLHLDIMDLVKPCYLSTRRILLCVSCSKALSLLRSDT